MTGVYTLYTKLEDIARSSNKGYKHSKFYETEKTLDRHLSLSKVHLSHCPRRRVQSLSLEQ